MTSDREHRTKKHQGKGRRTKGSYQMPDFKWKTIKPGMLLRRDVSTKKY